MPKDRIHLLNTSCTVAISECHKHEIKLENLFGYCTTTTVNLTTLLPVTSSRFWPTCEVHNGAGVRGFFLNRHGKQCEEKVICYQLELEK